MRKILLIAAIVALAGAPVTAAWKNGPGIDGGRGSIVQTSGYSFSNGGEFTFRDVTSGSMLLDLSAYSSLTKDINTGGGGRKSFQTFCVESNEHTDSNVGIWVSTGQTISGAGSHSWYGGAGLPAGNGDDLDPRTAWLYMKFARGILSGYNYTPGVADRAKSAGALQRVIWYLENEITQTTASLHSGLDPAQSSLADSWLAASSAGTIACATNLCGVRVLQVGVGDPASDGRRQDQLYLTIPAPGAALLGFLGLSAVGWIKRREASN